MRCFSNDVPGQQSRRDAIQKAVDEALAARVSWYYIVAQEESAWDLRFRLRNGQQRTLKVFPEDQPIDENDEKRLARLGQIVNWVLGIPTRPENEISGVNGPQIVARD